MLQDLSKKCADSLRTFSFEKHNINLRPAHAHELVAAYFGYSSKNALLADQKYPINKFDQAEIVVMVPDSLIDKRRKNLQGLSSELPDSYILGEAFYEALFCDEWWASPYPPFRGFEQLAKYLVENNDTYPVAFKSYLDIPVHHTVEVKNVKSKTLLIVIHAHRASNGEMLGHGKTTIDLPRVAGSIGFGKPQVAVEIWTSGARRTLDSVGVKS